MPSDPPTIGPSKSECITKLRTELKEWEYAFAKAHDGRKPTRDETKADKNIGMLFNPLLSTSSS